MMNEFAGYVAAALACTLAACSLVLRRQRVVELTLLTWGNVGRLTPRGLRFILFPAMFRSLRFARSMVLLVTAFISVLAGTLWVLAIGVLAELVHHAT